MEPILSNSANPQRRSAPCLQKESENRARSETSLPSEELFLASGMARLPVSKSYRGWVLGIAAILFLGVAAAFAYYVVFSRSMSPDEGYLMITVQSFVDGNALYDKVFTHYGPFYYAYEWVLHRLMFIPLTHDATRLLCIFHWLGAAVLFGCAGGVMMRSVFGGFFVFAQATIHLAPLANEPGHPQELIAVLLPLGMLIAIRRPPQKGVLESLGIIMAFLAFTKINIGFFFGLAVLLALSCNSANRFARGRWMWVQAGGCALMPFLLMRSHLAAEWCRNYSFVAASAIFGALVVAGGTGCSLPELRPHHALTPHPSPLPVEAVGTRTSHQYLASIVRFAACFIAASFLVCAIAFLTGTSMNGLLDGLLLTPLKMPGVALLPLPVANAALLNGAAALAFALLVARSAPSGGVRRYVGVMKLLYGFAGSLWLIDNPKAQVAYLLPWMWLVLVPGVAGAGSKSAIPFPRIFLCLAAAWESLQAYPIAGTQVTTATILLVLGYAICLSDFFQLPNPLSEKYLRLRPRTKLLVQALGAIGLLAIFANVWGKLPSVAREYASLPHLDLPGSRLVRMDLEATEMYRALSEYLSAECDTFVTYPGINSLYFWTGKRPPTHLNSTGWGPLTQQQQEQILAALRKARRPMLVIVAAAVQGWSNYAPPQLRPLLRAVAEDYREVKRIGRFIIFVPKSPFNEGP